ncbi:hypothetical protein AB0C15_10860 [Micromonospora sp. NPDC048835]|uniref:hypothetical protein n=1 Tax=Micromonospora sp. NPDC048835 TaxID=3155147 RepID=UPI0034038DC5
MSDDDLERGYRRLLAVYPWEHRRVYEDEMLAVLIADARPGQRRPAAADVRDLVGGGLRARLRVGARGFTQPSWADAATVAGLLVAVVLLAFAAKGLLNQLIHPSLPPGFAPSGPDLVDWLRVAGWAGVCAAALIGWRWVAAGLAWAGVLGWSVFVAPQAADNPTYVVDMLPQLALAVVTAAALTVPAPRRRAIALLGVRRLLVLVLAPTAVVALLVTNRVTSPTFDFSAVGGVSYQIFYGIEAGSELVLWLYVAGLAAATSALVIAVATLPAEVRRRIVVMLLPVAALALVIDSALAGWVTSTMNMGHAIPLVPAQWAMLLLVAPVTFLAGVLLVRRREETLRMVALGRNADREQPLGR